VVTSDPDEAERLWKRLQDHPATVAQRRWDSLRLVVVVFSRNTQLLRRHITQAESDVEIGAALINNLRVPNTIREHFETEMVRLLHNYLASTSTLIDHTRKHMKAYKNTSFLVEYNMRLARLVDADVIDFMKRLRNFALHQSIPPFGVSLQIAPGEAVFEVFLDRAALLSEPSSWTVGAKRYMTSWPTDTQRVLPLIDEHSKLVGDLYGWLFAQYEGLHGAEIDERNALVVELQGARNTPGHPDYAPWEDRPGWADAMSETSTGEKGDA